MQSYNNSFAVPLMILFFVMGILVTVGSAMPVDSFNSQYGGSVSIVDIDHNASQAISSAMNEFVVIRTLTPESVEVEVGDTVTWNNLQRPKKPIVVVSDDGLWEPQIIYYGKSFTYTFQNTGTYTFLIEGTQLKGTVFVLEKKLEDLAEEENKSDTSGSMPMMVWNGTKNVTQSMMDTVTGTIAELTRGTNEFLMIRTLQPTSMEIQAGETVVWHNLQRPKKPIVVVSDDGMWEPQTIYYGKVFNYTFDKPGNYTFMLEGTNITGTVVVTEVSTASAPESMEEAAAPSVPATSPVMVQDGTKERVQDRAEETVQTASRTNEFLMLRTITPTSMEVQSGENVAWHNLHRQKMPIVIISKEGLWEPQTLYYGKVFTYTFDKTGTYTFTLEGTQISGTIVVS